MISLVLFQLSITELEPLNLSGGDTSEPKGRLSTEAIPHQPDTNEVCAAPAALDRR